MQKIPGTFSELADVVFETLTRSTAPRVDFVADHYPEISIKAGERGRQAQRGTYCVQITRGSQPCPVQWKSYLSHGTNKTELVKFFAEEWGKNAYPGRLQHRSLYVTVGRKCVLLHSCDGEVVTSEEVPDLACTHEEVDTSLLLHAAHAALHHTAVVIHSSDTDVAMLCCAFQSEVAAPQYFRTGTKQRT